MAMTYWIISAGTACILLALAGIYRSIKTRTHRIMTALANVQTAETDLIAKTDALLAFAASNVTLIAQLQATIAAQGNVDPELQAVADALSAESAKVAAFLAPAPVTPPAA